MDVMVKEEVVLEGVGEGDGEKGVRKVAHPKGGDIPDPGIPYPEDQEPQYTVNHLISEESKQLIPMDLD